MRLVSYNIQFGRGRDGVIDLQRIVDAVRDADVVALQEVDRHWSRSGSVDQANCIAELLTRYDWVYSPGVDLASSLGPGRRRQFGNMLLSRLPILFSRHHLLPKWASTGPLSLQRSVQEAMIDFNGKPLRLMNLHLTHLSAQTRMPQLERVLEIHEDYRTAGLPVAGDTGQGDWAEVTGTHRPCTDTILLGDFNFEPDSSEYRRLAGPVSPYGGRVVHPEGFIDAFEHAGDEAGFTSDVEGRPARLDYFFVSVALAPRVVRCWVDARASGSDHQPLWLELEEVELSA
jgi:endonuclease/exonuclease/phosphatase family metal-dependent hydrolase